MPAAFFKGHFRLTSGLHSPGYLQTALLLQYPEYAETLGRELRLRPNFSANHVLAATGLCTAAIRDSAVPLGISALGYLPCRYS